MVMLINPHESIADRHRYHKDKVKSLPKSLESLIDFMEHHPSEYYLALRKHKTTASNKRYRDGKITYKTDGSVIIHSDYAKDYRKPELLSPILDDITFKCYIDNVVKKAYIYEVDCLMEESVYQLLIPDLFKDTDRYARIIKDPQEVDDYFNECIKSKGKSIAFTGIEVKPITPKDGLIISFIYG